MELFFLFVFALYTLASTVSQVCFFTLNKKLRSLGRILLPVAFGGHSLYLIARYISAGVTPVASSHDAISFFAWSLAIAYLGFRWRYRVKNFAAFVSPLIMLLMFIALFSPTKPLMSGYSSLLLPLHGMLALLANAFLVLAFSGGVMFLLHEREIKRKRMGFFSARLPSLEALDKLNQHCLTIGFPLLSIGMITGIIWSYHTKGLIWQWDPKETWSLVTWLIYAAMLHQRVAAGWRRRRAAIMSIVGFIAVLLTLWGVNLFLGGASANVG